MEQIETRRGIEPTVFLSRRDAVECARPRLARLSPRSWWRGLRIFDRIADELDADVVEMTRVAERKPRGNRGADTRGNYRVA